MSEKAILPLTCKKIQIIYIIPLQSQIYTASSKDKKIEVGTSYEEVLRYSMTPDGAIDLAKMMSLEGRFGGRCDVLEGPCACGAWHK